MGGAFLSGVRVKPSLSVGEQVALLARRGLVIDDEAASTAFLTAHNYYRFSGYARYFQQAPHLGDDNFCPGTTFDEIRAIYEADDARSCEVVSRVWRWPEAEYGLSHAHRGPGGLHVVDPDDACSL